MGQRVGDRFVVTRVAGRAALVPLGDRWVRVAGDGWPGPGARENFAEAPQPGGSVTFSPRITMGVEGLRSALRAWVKTLLRQARLTHHLHDVVVEVARDAAPPGSTHQDLGYTVGPRSRGRYIDTRGKESREPSYTVTFGGVSTPLLRRLAEGIRRKFQQESVWVHDFNTGRAGLWFAPQPVTEEEMVPAAPDSADEGVTDGERPEGDLVFAGRRRRDRAVAARLGV
jgi:hypothetical protein